MPATFSHPVPGGWCLTRHHRPGWDAQAGIQEWWAQVACVFPPRGGTTDSPRTGESAVRPRVSEMPQPPLRPRAHVTRPLATEAAYLEGVGRPRPAGGFALPHPAPGHGRG